MTYENLTSNVFRHGIFVACFLVVIYVALHYIRSSALELSKKAIISFHLCSDHHDLRLFLSNFISHVKKRHWVSK